MKRFLELLSASIALALFVSCVSSAPVKEDISSVTEESASTLSEILEKRETGPLWKIQAVEVFYPDGVRSAKFTTIYDALGIIKAEEQHSGTGVLVMKKTWAQKAPGVFEIVTTDAAGEVLGKSERTILESMVIRETLLSVKGAIQTTIEYTYDPSGQKKVWTVKIPSGKSITSEYIRENGNLVRILLKDTEGAVLKRFERAYSSQNLLTKEQEYDSRGALVRIVEYIYDDTGLIREDIKNGLGVLSTSIKYSNDKVGNPLAVEYYDRFGNMVEKRKQTWQSFERAVVKL